MEPEFKITFQPANRQVYALAGTLLLEAAARAGLVLRTPCGGAGTCGKCALRVVRGVCAPSADCAPTLGTEAVARGMRLACRARVSEDLVLEVPEGALFDPRQLILANGSAVAFDQSPSVAACEFEFPANNGAAEANATLEALLRVLPPSFCAAADLHALRRLPRLDAAGARRGTAIAADDLLLDVFSGRETPPVCGAVFDVGTTTLAGILTDLRSGRDLAVVTEVNPQAAGGDDVVARIRHCRENDAGLKRLQQLLIEALNNMLSELSAQARVAREHVFEIVLTGNTTMQQIACGIDPRALGELPFNPVYRRALRLRASELGLNIHPAGRAYVYPQIGGFVGGDTVAGIAAVRLDRMPPPVLLVDIGTNGEIVLAHADGLAATSVAAGPAFEGARIACGMRAVPGAIEKIELTGDVRMNVIGNRPPIGLCGSAMIDLLAEMLRAGILDATGRILAPGECPPQVPDNLRRRLRPSGPAFDFVLAKAGETGGPEILFTQRDVRELQLAAAAVRAGIGILLNMFGLAVRDLRMVLLAGGFGNFIRRKNAMRMGLLPALEHDRIRFAGNTALMGARLALLSAGEKEYAGAIAAQTRHVDLSLAPEFQAEFSAAMMFPAAEDAG